MRINSKKIIISIILVLTLLLSTTAMIFATPQLEIVIAGAKASYSQGASIAITGIINDSEGFAITTKPIVRVSVADIVFTETSADANGYFQVLLKLPEDSSSGSYEVKAQSGEAQTTKNISIQNSTDGIVYLGTDFDRNQKVKVDKPSLGVVFDANVNYYNNKLAVEVDFGVNENNRDCITLRKVSTGEEVPIDVLLVENRTVGDQPWEYYDVNGNKAMADKKKTIRIQPQVSLESNTEYYIQADGELSANSGSRLGNTVKVYFKTEGGSTGGSGGGTALPEKPKDNNTTIEAKPVISGDKATVTLSDSDLDNAIKNSKTGQENSITVQVTQDQLEKATKVGTLDLSLTSAQVKKLDGKMDKVVYDTPFGIVQLPLTVLSQGTGDMKLSITKVDQEKDTFIVTLSDSKGMITELKDRVKLEFPVTDATSNVLSHNGKIMKNAKVEGKNAYGITKGFSTFKAEKKTVTFGDITNHWAKSNIEFLAVRDIVNGVNKTEFGPNQSVTRSEFVKMLVNGFDELNGVTAGSAGFSDVKAGQWYTDYINWAASKKIVAGTGDGTFGTNQPISRQDMAVIMDRFAKEMDIALYAKSDKTTFADDSKIAAYAKDAVYTMQQAGIINGVGGNNFNPTGNATRAETSKMITMMIESMIQ